MPKREGDISHTLRACYVTSDDRGSVLAVHVPSYTGTCLEETTDLKRWGVMVCLSVRLLYFSKSTCWFTLFNQYFKPFLCLYYNVGGIFVPFFCGGGSCGAHFVLGKLIFSSLFRILFLLFCYFML